MYLPQTGFLVSICDGYFHILSEVVVNLLPVAGKGIIQRVGA